MNNLVEDTIHFDATITEALARTNEFVLFFGKAILFGEAVSICVFVESCGVTIG